MTQDFDHRFILLGNDMHAIYHNLREFKLRLAKHQSCPLFVRPIFAQLQEFQTLTDSSFSKTACDSQYSLSVN